MFRLTLISLLLLLLVPLSAGSQPAGEFGSWPFPDSVDALPESMHPGQPYNGFPNYQRSIDWMAIPSWMAGDWLSRDYRILKSYDHASGTLHTIPRANITPRADHFGDQVDRQGTIWSCNVTPFLSETPVEELSDAQLTIGMKPIEVRAEQVALWQRVLHVLYNPSNLSIHDSYTEERVTELAPTGRAIITAQSTSRFYDVNGNPTFTTNAMRLTRQTAPFRPLSQRNGVDLVMSLNEHLQNTGRGDLAGNQ